MHAEILAIGDELTSGQRLDTNSQWLSQRLEELGVRVLFHATVGDELEPCVAVFRQAIERSDLIVATGGLGPTADDLTREVLAQATGRSLRLDSDALESIRAMFARRRRPMPSSNELQAMFPVGSQVVQNRHGTAPGIDLEVPRDGRTPCRVICLPGVPAEMIEMWHDTVAAIVERFAGDGRRVIRRRCIHCFGAGESQIESMLPDMIRRGRQPTVGITASGATISLRIAAEGQTERECFAAMGPTVAMIRECLGTLVYGEEHDELQHVVARLLREQNKTLATLECGTAGLVAQWLASVGQAVLDMRAAFRPTTTPCQAQPDLRSPAEVFRGGLVLTKTVESVKAMAIRCREQFCADLGLAIGAEEPDELPSPACGRGAGGEGGEPKTVAIALASADGVQQKRIPVGIHPALISTYLAKHALNFARLALLDK